MKYFYIFLVFIFGVAVGRWSGPASGKKLTYTEVPIQKEPGTNRTPETLPIKTEAYSKLVEANSPAKDLEYIKPDEENQKLIRTDSKGIDKNIRGLFARLMEANEKGIADEQNRLFAEMEKLDPKHEKVFEAKTMFLQEDENWEGAHEVLKDCVNTLPDSLYCHRRLANIRSSTTEEKIYYGTRCVQIATNDPLCLVDVAMALHSKGEFTKAKDYFELALSSPMNGEGYHKEYILYQYALALENLNMFQKAMEALGQACRLKMKAACEKLKT